MLWWQPKTVRRSSAQLCWDTGRVGTAGLAGPSDASLAGGSSLLSGLGHAAAGSAEGATGGGGGAGGSGGGAGLSEGEVSETVQQLVAMGFSLPRAVQAHAQFGDDLDSMLEYLTSD